MRTRRDATGDVAQRASSAIRLSVLEPPCRCRDPIIAEQAARRRPVDVDVRHASQQAMVARVIQACDGLAGCECLRITMRRLSYPVLAALQATGCRYQVVRTADHVVELLAWRFLDAAAHDRYLRDGLTLDPGPAVPFAA